MDPGPEPLAVARARLAGVPFSYAERLGYSTVPGNSLRDAGGAPASGSSSTFFLQEFGLSNEDGIALMCISEASLRIPAIDNPGRLYRRGTHSGADRHMSGIVPGMLMEAPIAGPAFRFRCTPGSPPAQPHRPRMERTPPVATLPLAFVPWKVATVDAAQLLATVSGYR